MGSYDEDCFNSFIAAEHEQVYKVSIWKLISSALEKSETEPRKLYQMTRR